MENLIIGIAGGTGSGKSTFTSELLKEFGDNIAVVHLANYYNNDSGKVNYDNPAYLDKELIINDIASLKRGESIECPVYDMSSDSRQWETLHIEPKAVVIVEGMLTFAIPELLDLIDIKVFVDTDGDERIIRRILKDVNDIGKDVDEIVYRYLNLIKPMHAKYVEPTKRYADILINGGLNKVALELVKLKIIKELEERGN